MLRRCYLTVILLLSISAFAYCKGNIDQKLQESMIWTNLSDANTGKGICVGFRRQFDLAENPKHAQIHIFADSRYLLWVNGEYVERGPCRFDPKGPQYDSIDIVKFVKKGNNTVAILVQANVIGSLKIMKHTPGLTALIKIDGLEIYTDQSWLCSDKVPSQMIADRWTWSCILDQVDAKSEDFGWTNPEFNTQTWSKAIKIDASTWGPLKPRAIPLLAETDLGSGTILQVTCNGNVDKTPKVLSENLPIELKADSEVVIDIGKLSLIYWNIEFEADGNAKLIFTPCQDFIDGKTIINYNCENIYEAKQGLQSYISTDTFGFRYLNLKVSNADIKINSIKFVSRLYPNIAVAEFQSDDEFLNKTWQMASYTTAVLCEDGYVDSAERAEWMGDVGMIQYPASRKIISGPGKKDGDIIYSDSRLMRNMLRHTIESQQDDGRMKAHHPSDRWDLHWYIEDYCCLWVYGLRQYYDNTADIDFLKEAWPALERQMKWFIDRKNKCGLITARDFLIHLDNPLRYQVCQGATLNAFIYRAFVDSAYLAKAMGNNKQSKYYSEQAESLKDAYNKYLWDDETQTFYSAVYYPDDIKDNALPTLELVTPQKPEERNTQWVKPGQKVIPTIQAALLALNRGVVSEEHLPAVKKYLKTHHSELMNPYTHLFLFDEFYKIDTDEMDTEVLNIIRKRWNNMVSRTSPGTAAEGFETQGYLCHPFGLVPAYTLPAYVLGVHKPEPIWEKEILIEPRLGDLKYVKGVGLTELGPVPVEWKKTSSSELEFSFEIPKGVTATIRLPKLADNSKVKINNKKINTKEVGRFLEFKLKAGKYSGKVGN